MGGVSVPEELVRKVDVKFMQDMVGEKNCVSVELLDFSNQGGLSCDMFLIRSEHGDPSSDAALEVKTRVLKTFIGEGQLQKSSLFGLAREGLFMKAMNEKSTEGKRDAIKSLIPTVYYSEGDMATGEKLMIMEKMEGTQTGLLYTDKYHLCLWQKEESELAKIREEFGDNMSQFDVCKESFEMAAKLHASYWMDGEVLSKWEFLRGRGVIAPKDGDDWVDPLWKASQDDAMKGWSKVNELILDVQAKNGESHQFLEDMEFKDYESKMEFSQVDAIKMDPHLVRCVNESLSKIDFKEYCKIFGSGDNGSYPWSLVHGDFFPGNVLCCKGNGADKASAGNRFLKLVDFEMHLGELHGNQFCEQCEECGLAVYRSFDVKGIRRQKTGRYCRTCKGALRDTILDWDDPLPDKELDLSETFASKADLSLCLGTSLQIIPAADIPLKTVAQRYKVQRKRGRKRKRKANNNVGNGSLVIVNLQETPRDEWADLCMHWYVDDIMYYAYLYLNHMHVPAYEKHCNLLFEMKGEIRNTKLGEAGAWDNIFIESLDLFESDVGAPGCKIPFILEARVVIQSHGVKNNSIDVCTFVDNALPFSKAMFQRTTDGTEGWDASSAVVVVTIKFTPRCNLVGEIQMEGLIFDNENQIPNRKDERDLKFHVKISKKCVILRKDFKDFVPKIKLDRELLTRTFEAKLGDSESRDDGIASQRAPRPALPSSSRKTCVQCEKCLLWTDVPAGVDVSSLPAVYTCGYRSWTSTARCEERAKQDRKTETK
eukprot:Nk52_evm46s223 gene=Nk52_evmTU46s223